MVEDSGQESHGDAVEFDPDAVPEGLRDLISLVRRWGISCDVDRGEALEAATSDELAEISSRLKGRHDAIEDWLYSFPIDDPDSWSRAASAFQALVTAETEYCRGPGLKGFLGWAYRVHSASPSPETLKRLREAYEYTSRVRALKYQDPTLVSAVERALAGD